MNSIYPKLTKDLPAQQSYYMILTEDTYFQSTGYEEQGEVGNKTPYLDIECVFSEEELQEYVRLYAKDTSPYKKKFSFVKCIPMSYSISIETKVLVNI